MPYNLRFTSVTGALFIATSLAAPHRDANVSFFAITFAERATAPAARSLSSVLQ